MRELLREGYDLREAILKSAEVRMCTVLMTSLAAAIGLLPAAIASGIGAQSQQPLARVVVGGILTSAALILFVLPVLYQLLHRFTGSATLPNRQQLNRGSEVSNNAFSTIVPGRDGADVSLPIPP